MDDQTLLHRARRSFSGTGLALVLILIVTLAVQFGIAYGLPLLLGPSHWLFTSSWGFWIRAFLPMYAFGIPAGCLFFSALPSYRGYRNAMGAKEFFLFLLMCFPLMYAGNLIGTLLSFLLSGGQAQNQLIQLVADTNPLRVVVIVFLAPLLEELIFRKMILDHTRQYGEKNAVFLSALCFGLFHNNLFQFFYAFAIGLILGYVYLRYNRLRYSVLLHMILNFMGAVIAPWILSHIQWILDAEGDAAQLLQNLTPEHIPGLLLYLAYMMLLLGLTGGGIAALIVRRRRFVFLTAPEELPPKSRLRVTYGNVGMILFILCCLALIIKALLP